MIIAKKEKGKLIVLYKQYPLPNNQTIESFSLLKLNDLEANELILSASYWLTTKEGNLFTTYEHKDKLDTLFKKFACEHARQGGNFKDVRAIRRDIPQGTSTLVRNPIDKSIKIVRRTSLHSKIYLNVIPIDNEKREMFFRDCKQTYYPTATGKYEINARYNELSARLYEAWSNFMDREFVRLSSIK